MTVPFVVIVLHCEAKNTVLLLFLVGRQQKRVIPKGAASRFHYFVRTIQDYIGSSSKALRRKIEQKSGGQELILLLDLFALFYSLLEISPVVLILFPKPLSLQSTSSP